MLSLPRNPTSYRAWSPVPSPALEFRPDLPGKLRNLLPEGSQAGRRARVLEGCTQLSGFGKVTLRGGGDFGLNEIVNPGRTLESGEKHAARSPPQLLTRGQPCRGLGRARCILGLPVFWLCTGYLGAPQLSVPASHLPSASLSCVPPALCFPFFFFSSVD